MSLMSTDDKFVVSIPFKHLPAIYRLFGVSLACWELIPATCISMSLHLDTIGPSLSLFLTSLASTPSDWMGWLGPLAEQCFFPANFILLWVANGSKEEFIDLGRRNWTSTMSQVAWMFPTQTKLEAAALLLIPLARREGRSSSSLNPKPNPKPKTHKFSR